MQENKLKQQQQRKPSVFAHPDPSYIRPKSKQQYYNSNYSAESPKNSNNNPYFCVPVSPADSGVSSIESSPNAIKNNHHGATTPTPTMGQLTPENLNESLNGGPPPSPREIPFELPKSESKFNVPAPKDPRRVRSRMLNNFSPKSISPFRSPSNNCNYSTHPSFSPYNARSPAASRLHNQTSHSPMSSCSSPISSTSKNNNNSNSICSSVFEFKLPNFAQSPQVKHRFAILRQVSGYKRSFTIDPMFASEYSDETLRKKNKIRR